MKTNLELRKMKRGAVALIPSALLFVPSSNLFIPGFLVS